MAEKSPFLASEFTPVTSTLPAPIEAAANLPRPIQPDTDARVITMWIMRSRSAGTRRKYQMHAERFLAFLGRPLGTAGLGDLQDYLATFEGRAPATMANATHCLKSLLTFAHEVGATPFNVGRAVKAPRVKNTLAERIMVAADVRSMLALESDPRNKALLTLLYGAGLRISEAIGLRWRDLAVRAPSGQATVYGKGGKTRVVLLSVNTWQAVLGQRDEQDPDAFVFRARPSGRGLGLSQAHRIVKAAAARAGLPPEVSAHWLRHAHASHAIDAGAPIQLVQATLGHANVATTSRYLHARPNESSARFLGI